MPDQEQIEPMGSSSEANTLTTQRTPTLLPLEAPVPPQTILLPMLRIGELDERGNTVKYVFWYARDYTIYYSRFEQDLHPEHHLFGRAFHQRLANIKRIMLLRDGPYRSEGIGVQFTPDPTRRSELQLLLLPLSSLMITVNSLLRGWSRRQSYDALVASALQLVFEGAGNPEANENAMQSLIDTRAAILKEREITGRAQYVCFTLVIGFFLMILLTFAEGKLFGSTGNFWLGTQAGLIGAVLSIAVSIRGKTYPLELGIAPKLSDSALRLMIGAVSGGTLVLLFLTGLLPSLQTIRSDQNGVTSPAFAVLIGIIAGFAEQLVPGLLDNQSQRIGRRDGEGKVGWVERPTPSPEPASHRRSPPV